MTINKELQLKIDKSSDKNHTLTTVIITTEQTVSTVHRNNKTMHYREITSTYSKYTINGTNNTINNIKVSQQQQVLWDLNYQVFGWIITIQYSLLSGIHWPEDTTSQFRGIHITQVTP